MGKLIGNSFYALVVQASLANILSIISPTCELNTINNHTETPTLATICSQIQPIGEQRMLRHCHNRAVAAASALGSDVIPTVRKSLERPLGELLQQRDLQRLHVGRISIQPDSWIAVYGRRPVAIKSTENAQFLLLPRHVYRLESTVLINVVPGSTVVLLTPIA